jgi:acyl-CoA thioesterase
MNVNTPPTQGAPVLPERLANDPAAKALALELLQFEPGRARVRMNIRLDMANAHGICHGGFVFSLADSAFGYACNSYVDPMVAAGAAIDFIAPTRIGDVLTATATETMRTARHGIYDVVVTNQGGEVVAHFRGRCARLRVGTQPVESKPVESKE